MFHLRQSKCRTAVSKESLHADCISWHPGMTRRKRAPGLSSALALAGVGSVGRDAQRQVKTTAAPPDNAQNTVATKPALHRLT